MFVLNSKFQIGSYKWQGCNHVRIKKSIYEYIDTAVITLPTQAVVKQQNGTYSATSQTANQFKQGDKVSIQLGYSGAYNQEFTGFVSRVNIGTPCIIECEGYSYQLRTKTNIVKSWKTVSLKDALAYIIEGTDIVLSDKIPDIELKNFVLDNASGDKVIEYLKGQLTNAFTVFFQDNVLYCGLTYFDIINTTVKHRIGWNVISADGLKLRNTDDVKVQVQIEFKDSSGTSIIKSSGTPGGVVKKETVSILGDAQRLQDIADARFKQESYNGVEGSFTAFLVPFIQPGYRDELFDNKYTERQGIYFAESVETEYSHGGGHRNIQISLKLTDI